MRKKKLFIAATALLALVSCTSDIYLGDQEALRGDVPISFDMFSPALTRADKTGGDAATDLGNRFIIYGEKGAITNVAPTAGNFVFPNYQVNYVPNTAYTTTSNTKNWEYVGYSHSSAYQNNITRKASSEAAPVGASDVAQTIKYWDYGADNYIFTAVSAKDEDITDGRVKIQKNEYGTTAYDKGYTITLTKTTSPDTYPDLDGIYFSDRLVIAKSAGTDRDATNAYGGNVTLTFRNLVSHIRAGIYETIPGYDISSMTFYISDGDDAGTDLDAVDSHGFGAICPNKKATNIEGTINVVYYTDSDSPIENQPKVTFTGITPTTDLLLGSNFSSLSTSSLLKKSSTDPTWDTSGGEFTKVLPQIENNSNLKLTVDYTLWNSVTNETIEIKGATAEVPANYLQWKPNYKYTYLFKISNNTNGSSGQGVVGLYPITFDAIEIVAEDGNVEYITTVSEPSITTYAKASAVLTDDVYKTKNNIYIAVEDGSTNPTLTLNQTSKQSSANLYFVTLQDGAVQVITEMSVANAIAAGTESPTGTWTVTDAAGKDMVVTKIDLLSTFTTIPAADSPSGVDLSINGAKFRPVPTYEQIPVNDDLSVGDTYYKANTEDAESFVAGASAKADASTYSMTATGAGYYAFEYISYEAATTLTPGASLVGFYSLASDTYTKLTEGTYESGTYYKQVKTYKVIKVVAP